VRPSELPGRCRRLGALLPDVRPHLHGTTGVGRRGNPPGPSPPSRVPRVSSRVVMLPLGKQETAMKEPNGPAGVRSARELARCHGPPLYRLPVRGGAGPSAPRARVSSRVVVSAPQVPGTPASRSRARISPRDVQGVTDDAASPKLTRTFPRGKTVRCPSSGGVCAGGSRARHRRVVRVAQVGLARGGRARRGSGL